MPKKSLLILLVLLLCGASSVCAQGWDTVALPNQTVLLKEEEMNVNGQKIKSLHYRSRLPAREISDFYIRFLPGLGWNEDCPECSRPGNDPARLTFSRGENKISIAIIPTPFAGVGENDIIIAMSKIKEETEQAEEGEEAEGKDLSFVPRYPQSQRVSSLEYDAANKAMLTYSSLDTADEILDFYRQNMADYNWNLVDETDFQALPPELREIQSQIKLKGGSLIFKGPRGECVISVFEHPLGEEDSRIIGIKYNAK